MVKYYHPYVSDKPKYKFYIIKNNNKRLYFGDSNYEHYTEGHLDHNRRRNYMIRHMKNEDWTKSGIDSPGFWSYHYLWRFPSYKEAYKNIKKYI